MVVASAGDHIAGDPGLCKAGRHRSGEPDEVEVGLGLQRDPGAVELSLQSRLLGCFAGDDNRDEAVLDDRGDSTEIRRADQAVDRREDIDGFVEERPQRSEGREAVLGRPQSLPVC
jgi:hypothetical protein